MFFTVLGSVLLKCTRRSICFVRMSKRIQIMDQNMLMKSSTDMMMVMFCYLFRFSI